MPARTSCKTKNSRYALHAMLANSYSNVMMQKLRSERSTQFTNKPAPLLWPSQASLKEKTEMEGLLMNDENKRLKIAFLTSFDPLNRRSWSGTVYHLAQALQKHCGEVSYIGPMKIRQKTIGKIINK